MNVEMKKKLLSTFYNWLDGALVGFGVPDARQLAIVKGEEFEALEDDEMEDEDEGEEADAASGAAASG